MGAQAGLCPCWHIGTSVRWEWHTGIMETFPPLPWDCWASWPFLVAEEQQGVTVHRARQWTAQLWLHRAFWALSCSHTELCARRGGEGTFHFISPLAAEIALSWYRDPYLKAERKVKSLALSLFECSATSSSEGPDVIAMAVNYKWWFCPDSSIRADGAQSGVKGVSNLAWNCFGFVTLW